MKRLALACCIALIAMALSGCGNASANVSGASASAGSSSVSSSASDTESASSESVLLGSFEWPAESFGDLPEPDTEAQIIKTSTLDGGATVEYRDMTEAEVAAYIATVKTLGYTESATETKSETAYSYSAFRSSEGVMLDQVIIGYYVDKEGVATTSIGHVKV